MSPSLSVVVVDAETTVRGTCGKAVAARLTKIDFGQNIRSRHAERRSAPWSESSKSETPCLKFRSESESS